MRRIPALFAAVSFLVSFLALAGQPAPAQARMTRLKLSYGESQFVHFRADFRFPMNGIAWGGAHVSATGLVSFERPLGLPVPSTHLFSISSPAIAPLWATLDPSSGGEILVGHPDPDRFEVRYVNVPVIPASFPGPENLVVNATLTLHRDGRIDIAFGPTTVETALVGWTAGRAYADPQPPPTDLSHGGDPIGLPTDTAVFEWFPAGAFDLSDRTLHFRAPGPTGGRLGMANNECVFVRFPPGFTFPFETFPYAGAWIGANGYIAFGGRGFTDPTRSTTFVNEQVYIAPLWTDLNIDVGSVTVNMLDTTQLQFEWRDVVDRLTGQVLTFRLTLYATGHFEFDYDHVDGALGLAGFSAGHVRTEGIGHEVDLSAQSFIIPDDGSASLFEAFTLAGPADLSYRRFRFEPRQTPSDLISLGDDGFVEVVFPTGFNFPLAGRPYDRMFVNSNGNVTFDSSDVSWIESVPRFLGGFPRIAPFWDDLNPSVRRAVEPADTGQRERDVGQRPGVSEHRGQHGLVDPEPGWNLRDPLRCVFPAGCPHRTLGRSPGQRRKRTGQHPDRPPRPPRPGGPGLVPEVSLDHQLQPGRSKPERRGHGRSGTRGQGPDWPAPGPDRAAGPRRGRVVGGRGLPEHLARLRSPGTPRAAGRGLPVPGLAATVANLRRLPGQPGSQRRGAAGPAHPGRTRAARPDHLPGQPDALPGSRAERGCVVRGAHGHACHLRGMKT
jgi:hypothetical protein